MLDLDQLVTTLKQSSELQRKIARNVGSSTVALFAVLDVAPSELLKLAGTGTLVTIDDCHGILTAAHVWEEVLKSAAKVGITLAENIDHRFLIDKDAIVPTTIKPEESTWNEWGPDLTLLRIPPEQIGAIKAFQVFEDLKAPPKRVNAQCVECWIATGTPKELGGFTQNYARVEITGNFVVPESHRRRDQDYYDFDVDTTVPGVPKDFGGFSGGGLWRILVYASPDTGEIDWVKRLKGVVFWQFPMVDNHRIIRAHGPKSILGELLKSNEVYESLEAALCGEPPTPLPS